MSLFRRATSPREALGRVAESQEMPAPTDPPAPEIRVSRTVVKSEPELAELVAREPRLRDERVDVSLVEKGFGTRVAIVARSGEGLEQTDLEQLLDRLAEPQKRPFTNA
jgi:hypothetical protein